VRLSVRLPLLEQTGFCYTPQQGKSSYDIFTHCYCGSHRLAKVSDKRLTTLLVGKLWNVLLHIQVIFFSSWRIFIALSALLWKLWLQWVSHPF